LAVFAHWINDGGTVKYPHSWRGLYDLLCAVGHRETAITVIKKFNSTHKLSLSLQ
jgi:hypothetical protein